MRPLLLTLLVLIGCSEEAKLEPADTNPRKPAEPEKFDEHNVPVKGKVDEPDYVSVDHILIAYRDAGIPGVTRSLAEARKLAYDLFKQVQEGGDWAALKRKYSNDPGPTGQGGGPYGMTNTGALRQRGARPRSGMVSAFGDVGFILDVGEIGLAVFDKTKSPFGYHIIKRVK